MNKILIILISIIALSACSIGPKTNTAIITYDFGLPISQQDAATKTSSTSVKNILVADVRSTHGLNNTMIKYRLAFNNPSRSYSYANNRWVAPPSQLLTQQLSHKIVTSTDYQVIKESSTARSDYVLHLELDEFTQVFETLDNSHAYINMRASLIERKSHVLVGQQTFNTQQYAPTADAAGAVSALIDGSNQLINEIVDWLINTLENH